MKDIVRNVIHTMTMAVEGIKPKDRNPYRGRTTTPLKEVYADDWTLKN